jgi:hypothetical protein
MQDPGSIRQRRRRENGIDFGSENEGRPRTREEVVKVATSRVRQQLRNAKPPGNAD